MAWKSGAPPKSRRFLPGTRDEVALERYERRERAHRARRRISETSAMRCAKINISDAKPMKR